MEAFMNDAFLYLVLMIIGAVFVYVHSIALLSSTRNFVALYFPKQVNSALAALSIWRRCA